MAREDPPVFSHQSNLQRAKPRRAVGLGRLTRRQEARLLRHKGEGGARHEVNSCELHQLRPRTDGRTEKSQAAQPFQSLCCLVPLALNSFVRCRELNREPRFPHHRAKTSALRTTSSLLAVTQRVCINTASTDGEGGPEEARCPGVWRPSC